MTIGRNVILGLVGALLLASPAFAQTHPSTERFLVREKARAAFNEKLYKEAAALYRQLIGDNRWDGRLWLEYARAVDALGQRQEAIEGLEKAYELGVGWSRPGLARRVATHHAQLGNPDQATQWLDRALTARWHDRIGLYEDTSFASLRSDPRFVHITGVLTDKSLSRDEGWRHDLAFLTAEAKRLHKDIERPAYSSPFEAAAKRLHDRIPELTDAEVVAELQRLVSMLNDGHSHVFPRKGAVRLPLDFYAFREGLYIIGAVPELQDLRGARVLAFGPVPTEKALEELKSHVSRDNPMGLLWLGPQFLRDPVVLKVIGATRDTTRVQVTVEDPDGRTRTVSVHPVAEYKAMGKLAAPWSTPDTTALYLKKVDDFYWYTPLPESDAIYFQFNQVIPKQDQSIPAFAADLQAALVRTGARNLIVDVRHNHGGNSYAFTPLIRVMAHFQQSAPDHQIYMLIGRQTFSAAQNFTTLVATLTNAIFVGEPTGSKPAFVGEVGGFRLPYSGTMVNVSYRTHQGTIWDEDPIWIAPEVPVEPSVGDYLADRDPALEAVLELIQNRKGAAPYVRTPGM